MAQPVLIQAQQIQPILTQTPAPNVLLVENGVIILTELLVTAHTALPLALPTLPPIARHKTESGVLINQRQVAGQMVGAAQQRAAVQFTIKPLVNLQIVNGAQAQLLREQWLRVVGVPCLTILMDVAAPVQPIQLTQHRPQTPHQPHTWLGQATKQIVNHIPENGVKILILARIIVALAQWELKNVRSHPNPAT